MPDGNCFHADGAQRHLSGGSEPRESGTTRARKEEMIMRQRLVLLVCTAATGVLLHCPTSAHAQSVTDQLIDTLDPDPPSPPAPTFYTKRCLPPTQGFYCSC